MAPDITIAIPIFNETKGVYNLIKKTVHLPFTKEVIIIDDGSDEATKKILKTVKDDYPEIKIIINTTNIGKTASIQKALKFAKGNFFVILDGDCELDPEDVLKMYNKAKKNNLGFVNGTRIIPRKHGLFSHFESRLAKKIVSVSIRFLFGKKIKDPLSGLKLFYTRDFKHYEFSSKKFGLETELITETIKKGYPIYEMEVNYYPRSYKEGKKIQLRDGPDIMYPVLSKFNLDIFWKRSFLSIFLVGLIVWFISFSIYNFPSNPSPTTDTIPNTFTAANLLYNKRLDLTNFKSYFEKRQIVSYVSVENSQAQLFAKTPIINGILMVPYLYIVDQYNGIEKLLAGDFFHQDLEAYYQLIGKQYGSLVTSFSVLFVFFILYILFNKKLLAFIWALVYALGTSVYSTASQGSWQHAPSLLLISIVYLCLLLFLKKENRWLLSMMTFFLAIATLIRISNLVFFLSISVSFLLHASFRKYVPRLFFQFIIPIMVWLIVLNRINIPGGYNSEIILSLRSISVTHTLGVMLSLLISPNVGLLIFSPICLFGLIGIIKLILNKQSLFLIIAAVSFLGIFLFDSIWWAWEGGYSWGPRLLTEGMPFIIFLGAYTYVSTHTLLLKKGMTIVFFLLFFYSFFIQVVGVYAYETEWQSTYFKRDGTFVTAWFNKPSIINFYLQRKQFHTVVMHKENNSLYIDKNYYLISLDFNNPFVPIKNKRYTIKEDDMGRGI